MFDTNFSLYLKAITTLTLPAASSYWLNAILITLYSPLALDDSIYASFINQYLKGSYIILPSALLLLPVLTGFLIDRVTVFLALRILGFLYIISGGSFLAAWISGHMWLYALSIITFLLSFNLACLNAFIFVSETMLGTAQRLGNFIKILGLCFSLICVGLLLFNSFDLDDNVTIFSIGGVLLSLATFFSFRLSKDDYLLRVSVEHILLTGSTNSSLVIGKSIIFNDESSEEYEHLLYDEPSKQYDKTVRATSKPTKGLSVNVYISICLLGILIGSSSIIGNGQQIETLRGEWISYQKPIQYVLFGITAVLFSFINWQKPILEKAIIVSAMVLIFIAGLEETGFSKTQTFPLLILQNLARGGLLVLSCIYFPFLVNFKLGHMGRTLGLCAWMINLLVLGGIFFEGTYLYNQVSFSTAIIGSTFLTCLVFMCMTLRRGKTNENKKSPQLAHTNI